MKDAAKKFLKLFVTNEEEEPDKIPEQETPVEQKSATGKMDMNIAKTLTSAVEEANIDGYDYFEFSQTVEALKPGIPSEQTLFQTAFASAKVMKATKDSLLSTAKHYLNVLDKKALEFHDVVKGKIDESVTGKEDELKKIDQDISEKAERIKALTEEINSLSDSRKKVADEMAENKIRIEKIRNDFEATLKMFVDRITSDIEKIGKYIS